MRVGEVEARAASSLASEDDGRTLYGSQKREGEVKQGRLETKDFEKEKWSEMERREAEVWGGKMRMLMRRPMKGDMLN